MNRFALSCTVLAAAAALLQLVPAAPAQKPRAESGALRAVGRTGDGPTECPLKHTDVKAEISGSVSRVTVTQHFENPFSEKIEAVYTFPLPQNAAVDAMTMHIGERTVRGVVKTREEARAAYDTARRRGQAAGLLDQERPNIFTQSVANILPGEQVKIEISYVERLKYEDGSYEWVFPMVVGPRYIPGTPVPSPNPGGGWSYDTDTVPDASRITPRPVPPGTRAGHDIAVEVSLDSGVPVDSLVTPSHETAIRRPAPNRAAVRLRDKAVIPNKDFILRWDVASQKIQDAVLMHRDSRGGFFTLVLQPPERAAVEDVTPKELVFVLDTSGSMSGIPIEKAKETMRLALDGLNPNDTFNLITFSGDTHVLFPRPVPATAENLQRAQQFLATRAGGGGTEMMKAIRASMEGIEQGHIRIVCFMTDGYVGNDFEIISEVQKHPEARVFSFGIGSSVNRFLLDRMAEHGRGEVDYVGLTEDGAKAARRFHERVRNPLLTDVSVEWGGLPVSEIYPKRIPDLFSAKPVVLTGRYDAPAKGVIRLRGTYAGRPITREIQVNLPASEPAHDTLASLWARTKIDDLIAQDFAGMRGGAARPDVREGITKLGLDFRLMTQFTSFVAVEEMVITEGGQPRRVDVPVEMPEGVSYEGVFGAPRMVMANQMQAQRAMGGSISAAQERAGVVGGVPAQVSADAKSQAGQSRNGVAHGVAGGAPGGVLGGIIGSVPSAAPPPPPPPAAREAVPAPATAREPVSRMHPSVAAVIARINNKTAPAASEAQFVRNGKAEIQVWFQAIAADTLAKLKELGFEIVAQPKSGATLVGRVPVERLAALLELPSIRYVAPAPK